ncbi:MAG: hypothetical protein ACYC9O_21580 [Candidatus Latescibacterota bacterium]
MKKQHVIPLVVLMLLSIGCSILQKERKQDIIGIWTGKATVAHQDISKNYDATLTFREDMTMTLTYVINGNNVTLNGNYTADLLKRPAQIDIRNLGFPKSKTFYCCLAIAEFPMKNKMNISGLLGQCGEISRPAEFNRHPSNNHQLYLELVKKK